MSRDLQIDFSFGTQQGLSYWWIIFFERLSFYGFRFENPNLSHSNGNFILSTVNETKSVEAPFPVLWEHVMSEEATSIYATFWHRQSERGLTIGLSFARDMELQQLDFGLTLPGGDFGLLPLDCAARYLRMIFQCTKEMLDVCAPQSAEIAWEDSSGYFAPWASLGLPTRKPANSWEHALQRSDQIMCNLLLSNGQPFYYLNPVPIARTIGEWDFVPLNMEN